MRPDHVDAVALEQDAAHEDQEVRERQHVADHLRPLRHAAKRKHEAGEQQRRHEEEDRHLHRLQLVACNRTEGDAERQIGADEEQHDGEEQEQAAVHRHVEQPARGGEDQCDLDQADQDVGNDLTGHHFERCRRCGQQILEGTAFALAGHGEAGHQHHGQREDDAHQAGNDVVGSQSLRVETAMHAQFDRWRGRTLHPRQVGRKHIHAQPVQHRNRAVGRHRIGGISFDQHDRRLPAHQIAVETRWKGDDELHFAAIEQAVSLTLIDAADDAEVIAVLHRRDVGTSKRPRIGHDDGGRHVLGIGIDRVAEKH